MNANLGGDRIGHKDTSGLCQTKKVESVGSAQGLADKGQKLWWIGHALRKSQTATQSDKP